MCIVENQKIFAKIARLQGSGTFIAIIASPLAIFAKIANFAKITIFAKIACLQEATFGIQFKSPEAGDFSPVSPFSPLHAFLDISDIFTNNTTVSSKSGLILSDISDHLPIFSIVFGDYLRKDSKSLSIRDTSEIRVNEFRHKLENTNWNFSDQNNNANDPHTAYNIFIDKHTG